MPENPYFDRYKYNICIGNKSMYCKTISFVLIIGFEKMDRALLYMPHIGYIRSRSDFRARSVFDDPHKN